MEMRVYTINDITSALYQNINIFRLCQIGQVIDFIYRWRIDLTIIKERIFDVNVRSFHMKLQYTGLKCSNSSMAHMLICVQMI